MAICKFYQQGNCRYGNNCRFEHPNSNRDQTSNRFGALGGGNNNRGGSSRPNDQYQLEKYNISTEVIEKDLTSDRPQWILSAYGPGRDAPDQLFGGFPREQSFEELRVHYLNGKASGNEQQALDEAQKLYQSAESQMANAHRNAMQAAMFIVDGQNRHPNRIDICQQGTQGAPFGEFLVGKRQLPGQSAGTQGANPFGSPAAPTAFGGSGGAAAASSSSSAFGQPSALGQRASPFGSQPSQPAAGSSNPFGSQAAPTTSAFGQPPSLGAKPNPFGTPAFGQAAQPAAPGGAFGQPSALGQKPNPFASTAGAAAGASPFGSAANNTNATGNNQPAPSANPFGSNANSNTGASPFGAFGGNNNNNNTNNNTTTSPFGNQGSPAPSAFGSANSQPNTASSPFGQAAPTSSPFGKPAAPAANPFGSLGTQSPPAQPNPFGQKQESSPFGQQPSSSNPNPFGQQQPSAPAVNGMTQISSSGTNGPYPPKSAKQHPPPESYIVKGMDSRLTSFKGQAVTYRDGKPGLQTFSGAWTKIWFPSGPPGFNKDTALAPDRYDAKSKAQWDAFAQTGTFQDGMLPSVPPPRECTTWDF